MLPVTNDPAKAPMQTIEIIQETSSALFLSRNMVSVLFEFEFFKMRLISDSTTRSLCIDEMAGDVQLSVAPSKKAPSKAVNAARNWTPDALISSCPLRLRSWFILISGALQSKLLRLSSGLKSLKIFVQR